MSSTSCMIKIGWRIYLVFAEVGKRVIWGTDWPSPGVRDLRENLDQFLSLPLDEELKDAITRHTPLALFPQR